MAQPNIRVMGDKELARALKMLGSATVVKRVSRKAVRAACQPIRKEMKVKAPRRLGHLKKSIITKMKTYASGVVAGITGPRSKVILDDKGKRINPAKYAHLVEYGTAPHVIPGAVIDGRYYPVVQHPGAPAQPFMRPAFVGKKEAAFTAARRKYAQEIPKEARRARKGKR